jgi:hypothetical protein
LKFILDQGWNFAKETICKDFSVTISYQEKKNGEALESFMGIWPSRRNFPEFQMSLKFGVASDQLSAQPHNCRSNNEKKTSHSIKKHSYCFDIE